MIRQNTLIGEPAEVIPAESKWVDRLAMIRKAIQEGIPLNQIEQRLDWLDYLFENTSPRPSWTPSRKPQSASDVPRNGKKATDPLRNSVTVVLPRTTPQITRGANHEPERETQ